MQPPPDFLAPVIDYLNGFKKKDVKTGRVIEYNPPLYPILDAVYKRVESNTAWEQEIHGITFDHNLGGSEIAMNTTISLEVTGGFAAECLYEYWGNIIPGVNKGERNRKIKIWRDE